MKTCPNCKKEIEDGQIFCPYCGAEIDSKKKKISFIEKREARERERLALIEKASLHDDDFENAGTWDVNKIKIEKKGVASKIKTREICLIVVEVVLFVLSIVWGEIVIRGNAVDNVKLLVILVAFFICAICAGCFINDLNYIRNLVQMMKSKIAIKKIKYGKNPIIYYNNDIYEMNVTDKCPCCGGEMHIEEYNSKFVAVCNKDRSHLFVIDSQVICEKITNMSA